MITKQVGLDLGIENEGQNISCSSDDVLKRSFEESSWS